MYLFMDNNQIVLKLTPTSFYLILMENIKERYPEELIRKQDKESFLLRESECTHLLMVYHVKTTMSHSWTKLLNYKKN